MTTRAFVRVPMLGVLRRWVVVALCAFAGLLAVPAAQARQDAPEKPAVHADPSDDTSRWIRVVELDDGAITKLQLVSREFRRPDGTGPSVFLTGAVHVADKAFYDGIQAYLDAKDVVLFEGVKPPGAGRLDLDALAGNDESLAKATTRRIRFVATFIEKYRHEHKKYPQTLRELVDGSDGRMSKLIDGCLSDAWGHPLVYSLKAAVPTTPDPDAAAPRPTTGSSGFDLVSRGADGAPGGDGVDTDLRFDDQPSIKRAEIVQGEGIQRQLAAALRLEFQLDAMNENKANWRNSDLSVDQVMDRFEAAGVDGNQLFSLVGGGSFMDAAIGVVARLVGMSRTLSTMLKMAMVDMLCQADRLISAAGGDTGRMMEIIIEDRNKVVIDDLVRVIHDEPNVKSIGIIYGAGHLPDMEKRLRDTLGMEPVAEKWFDAITVKASDAGLSPEEARKTRKMFSDQIEQQIRAMQRGR